MGALITAAGMGILVSIIVFIGALFFGGGIFIKLKKITFPIAILFGIFLFIVDYNEKQHQEELEITAIQKQKEQFIKTQKKFKEYQKKCKENDYFACGRIVGFYFNPKNGISINKEEALKKLMKIANLSVPMVKKLMQKNQIDYTLYNGARESAIELLYNSTKTKKDISKIKKLCHNNKTYACIALGKIYKHKFNEYNLGNTYLRKGCSDFSGCSICLEEGIVRRITTVKGNATYTNYKLN